MPKKDVKQSLAGEEMVEVFIEELAFSRARVAGLEVGVSRTSVMVENRRLHILKFGVCVKM